MPGQEKFPPCYAAGEQWPDNDDDNDAPVYVVRFHPPFLVVRVDEMELGPLRLFPWPSDTFRDLPEAEQLRITNEIATFFAKEVEKRPPRPEEDRFFVINPKETPPPFLTVDNNEEDFTAVVRLRPPVGWAQIVDAADRRGDEFKNWQTPEGKTLDADAGQEMLRYYLIFGEKERAADL